MRLPKQALSLVTKDGRKEISRARWFTSKSEQMLEEKLRVSIQFARKIGEAAFPTYFRKHICLVFKASDKIEKENHRNLFIPRT